MAWNVVTVHVEITGYSGFTTPPTLVVPQAQQTEQQGSLEKPALRLVR